MDKLRDKSHLAADSTDRDAAKKLYSGRLASKIFDDDDEPTEGIVRLMAEDPNYPDELWFSVHYEFESQTVEVRVGLEAHM